MTKPTETVLLQLDAGHGAPVIEPDTRLLAEGWQLRFVSAGERVGEMVDLYSAIGYETHLESAVSSCSGCAVSAGCEQKVIYTRRLAKK